MKNFEKKNLQELKRFEIEESKQKSLKGGSTENEFIIEDVIDM